MAKKRMVLSGSRVSKAMEEIREMEDKKQVYIYEIITEYISYRIIQTKEENIHIFKLYEKLKEKNNILHYWDLEQIKGEFNKEVKEEMKDNIDYFSRKAAKILKEVIDEEINIEDMENIDEEGITLHIFHTLEQCKVLELSNIQLSKEDIVDMLKTRAKLIVENENEIQKKLIDITENAFEEEIIEEEEVDDDYNFSDTTEEYNEEEAKERLSGLLQQIFGEIKEESEEDEDEEEQTNDFKGMMFNLKKESLLRTLEEGKEEVQIPSKLNIELTSLLKSEEVMEEYREKGIMEEISKYIGLNEEDNENKDYLMLNTLCYGNIESYIEFAKNNPILENGMKFQDEILTLINSLKEHEVTLTGVKIIFNLDSIVESLDFLTSGEYMECIEEIKETIFGEEEYSGSLKMIRIK